MKHRLKGWIQLLLAVLLLLAGCRQLEAPKASKTTGKESVLEISEVVSGNEHSCEDEVYGTADWIELHNSGSQPLSLDGWSLSDKYFSRDAGRVLPSITLAPGAYCVIFADKDYEGDGDRCLPFGISRSGETLYLFDSMGQLAVILEVPALEKDVSWARREDGTYGYCLAPTPGKANTTEILAERPAAPQERSSAQDRRSQVQVQINEVCSAPGSGETDWIELYNPTEQAVDVTGFYLTDSSTNATKGVLPALTVPAQGYLVVPLGALADPLKGVLTFSLSSEGEAIYLFDGELALVDTVDVPALQEGLVYARGGDGAFGYCGVPTPGAANSSGIHGEPLRTMAAEGAIHMNEGLFRNRYSAIDAYGDHSDWVELENRSDHSCSLAGYYLSDDRNDLAKWPLPDRELGPGEYLLVFLSGQNATETELHAPFSISDQDEGCFLYWAEGLEVECLPYPKDLPENVSLGLDGNGQLVCFAYPTPGYANAQSFPGPIPASIFPAGAIFISEASAGGDDGDWVELYNRGEEGMDLSGWHLSDDRDSLQKLSLDGLSLEPGGYAVVPLSKKGERALFSIALAGEELLLSDDAGAVRDVFATGALRAGRTSGRVEGSPEQGRVFFQTPTPSSQNSDIVQGYAAQPVLSDMALYHEEPFVLTMRASGADTVIHYTLDGSAPTESSAIYTEPLTIDKTTVVRTVSTAENRFNSGESIMTYLFRQPHTLPVVCIAAEPDRWSKLMKAPFLEAGLEEQPVWVAYHEADGTLGTVFPAGISPRGNASLSYKQKSLSVHLRGAYGQSAVSYPFWGQDSFLSYRFLVLRNGSQDILFARLRDSFASRAAEKLRVMTVKTRPVIVYVNGAYYGIMDLNEGMNHDYLWTHYKVEGDLVNIVQRNDSVKRGSADGFLALRQYARQQDMADDTVYDEFCQRVDMDALIDYLIAQSFFGNYDIHNQNWWSTTDGSIPWQPMLYDIDRCLNDTSVTSNVLDMYFNPAGVVYNQNGDRIMMEIPCGLKKNAAWRQRFVERYAQVLSTEFAEERLQALLDEMADALRPEMEAHVARWGMPSSMIFWEGSIQQMHQCISKRYDRITAQIKSQFGLSDGEWDALMSKYSGKD